MLHHFQTADIKRLSVRKGRHDTGTRGLLIPKRLLSNYAVNRGEKPNLRWYTVDWLGPQRAGAYNEQRHINQRQEMLNCMALLVIGGCSLRAQPVYPLLAWVPERLMSWRQAKPRVELITDKRSNHTKLWQAIKPIAIDY